MGGIFRHRDWYLMRGLFSSPEGPPPHWGLLLLSWGGPRTQTDKTHPKLNTKKNFKSFIWNKNYLEESIQRRRLNTRIKCGISDNTFFSPLFLNFLFFVQSSSHDHLPHHVKSVHLGLVHTSSTSTNFRKKKHTHTSIGIFLWITREKWRNTKLSECKVLSI